MSLINGVYILEGGLAGGEDTAGAAASVGLEAGEEAGEAEASTPSATRLSESKSRVLGLVSGNVGLVGLVGLDR